jgi:hypothetical protein
MYKDTNDEPWSYSSYNDAEEGQNNPNRRNMYNFNKKTPFKNFSRGVTNDSTSEYMEPRASGGNVTYNVIIPFKT